MKTEKEKREEEEEDLRPFRIHAYSKEELAMLYNPTYCISNAIYTLAAWIRHNKALRVSWRRWATTNTGAPSLRWK